MPTLLLLAAVTVASITPTQPATLTGVVQSESGRPLRGASVFIRTAQPRVGVGDL